MSSRAATCTHAISVDGFPPRCLAWGQLGESARTEELFAIATLTASPVAERTDHELVGAVRSGDDSAFGALYTRHHRHVTAIVVGMVRDRARAEDIVQDVFVSALRRMRRTDSEIHFRGWISEIARNASIDHFRRANRGYEISMDSEAGLPAPDARRLGTAPAPEHTARGRERFVHLRGALDELTDTHQRVIVLREFEGHSYHEIGRLMDLTPSGVESTLFRARRRLETEYEALDTGERCRLVQRSIGAMTEGAASRREVGRVRRHVARCSVCAHHARMEGVDTSGRLARVAALLPVPPLFERRGGALLDSVRNLFASGSAAPQALAPASAWEQAAPTVGKALAVAAAAFTIGHGPASTTLSEEPVGHGPSATTAKPVARAVSPAPAHSGASRGAGHGPTSAAPARSAGAATSGGGSQSAAPRGAARPRVVAPRPVAPTPPRAPSTQSTPSAAPSASTNAGTAAASGVTGAVGRVLGSTGAQRPNTSGAPTGQPQSVTSAVESALPTDVTVPGASRPLVKPRETVQQVDSAVRGVLGQ